MPVSFSDHIDLLATCLDRRSLIVEAVERQVLNVQDKEPARSRDRGRLETLLLGSFDGAVALPTARPHTQRSPRRTRATASSRSYRTPVPTGSILRTW